MLSRRDEMLAATSLQKYLHLSIIHHLLTGTL